MSIPPLVCSTPPPLDQCEDDKDSEDFDSQYNLSQEDDDNYNYGDLSAFNYYHKSPEKQKPPPAVTDTNKTHSEYLHNGISDVVHKTSSPESRPSKNDINIEDSCTHTYLNLIVNETLEKTTIVDQIQTEISSFNISDINSESKIPSASHEIIEDKDNFSHNLRTNLVGNSVGTDVDHIVEPPTTTDQHKEYETQDLKPTDSDIEFDTETKSENQFKVIKDNGNAVNSGTDLKTDEHNDKITSTQVIDDKKNEAAVTNDKPDDDFFDFHDFQYATTSNNLSTILDSCDNRWENKTETTDDDFGQFKTAFAEQVQENRKELNETEKQAEHSKESEQIKENVEESDDFGDFDDFKSSKQNVEESDDFGDFEDFKSSKQNVEKGDDFGEFDDFKSSKQNVEESDGFGDFEDFKSSKQNVEKSDDGEFDDFKSSKQKVEESDNFGDFSDFKSSEKVSKDNAGPGPAILQEINKIIDLHDKETEDELRERLNKMYCPIFAEELPEPVEELEDDLKSIAEKTGVWKNLKELPTHKWSSKNPTTEAPSLSHKSSVSQTGTVSQDKQAAKTTWSDPFASEGQESGNDARSSDHHPVKISPTDLDVLEASTSSKPDKIYSSPMNPQTVRQISLPDTHIFTPTDSETPKSQTIHYDHTIILPPPPTTIASASRPQKETPVASPSTNTDIDDEYWEFQGFQGPTTTWASYSAQSDSNNMEPQPSTSACVPPPPASEILSPQPLTSGYSSTSTAFGTQVLQPIKVEPAVPTLNWPDPGEVRESFDDFSDFISTPTWSGNQESSVVSSEIALSKSEIVPVSKSAKVPGRFPAPVKIESNIPPAPTATVSDFDDDFDTFQSALPQKNLSPEVANKSLDRVNMTPRPVKTTTPVYASPITNKKSDVISFPTTATSSRPANVSVNPIVRSNDTTKVNPIKSSTLQPQPIRLLTPTILKPTPANKPVKQTQNLGQILQPLSLESYSQINWPNPGIDLQDLSSFNPVETLKCLKSDLSTKPSSKGSSPAHTKKSKNQQSDDDWGEFVSSKPKPKPQQQKTFADDVEWSDFVCNPTVNTISLNVHTNRSAQKSAHESQLPNRNAQKSLGIPTLNYITPKTNKRKSNNDKQFQNL